jgi:hypothetical protein
MIPHMLALLGNVVLWVSYAFAAICLTLLVYAASEGGAREVATWVIYQSAQLAIVIGSVVQYILGGRRKA